MPLLGPDAVSAVAAAIEPTGGRAWVAIEGAGLGHCRAAVPRRNRAGTNADHTTERLGRLRGSPWLVIALALTYGACFAGIKAGLPFAPPLLFAGLRALLAGLTLLLLLAVWRRPLLPSRGTWGWVLALGFTSTTIALGAMSLGPGHAGAGIASVLGNLQPVLVLALAAPVLGERITLAKGAALALGFTGALLISSSMLNGSGPSDVFGPLLALAASLSVATGNVLAKRMGAQPRLIALAAWQLLVGSLPLLAGSALLEPGATVDWDPRFIAILLFLAVGVTALPTPIWYWLVRETDDLGQLTLFLLLVPVAGLALGAGLFEEALSAGEIIGTGVILAGVVVAARAGAPAGRLSLALPCQCPSSLGLSTVADSGPPLPHCRWRHGLFDVGRAAVGYATDCANTAGSGVGWERARRQRV